MGNIPLPALSIRPPENPLDQYAKALSVKSALQGQQIQQNEITMQNLQIKDQQAITAAMTQWDGKDFSDLPSLILKNGGSAQSVMGVRSKIIEQQQAYSKIAADDAATGAKNMETYKARNDQIAGRLESLDDISDDQLTTEAHRAVNGLISDKLIDSAHAEQLSSAIDNAKDPNDLRQQIDHYAKLHMGASAMAEDAQKKAQASAEQWKTFPGLGALVNINSGEVRSIAGAGGVPLTPQMMESKYVNLQSQLAQGQKLSDSDAAFVKGYEKMKTLVPMFNFNLQGGATPLTGAALDQQVNQYHETGTLPPIGRGGAGMMLRNQILNRHAELYPSETPAAGSAQFKANSASLKELQSNLDQVSAFENTANKNLDMFTSLAQKAINTGVPLLNAPLREGAKLLAGSQDQLALDAARQVAVNEIAKVTSNPGLKGQLSDTARKEVDAFIPASATYGQALRVAQVLKQDMANRHESYQQQIGQIQGRLGIQPQGAGGATQNTGALPKSLSAAQITAYAAAHNVSEAEVKRQAKAKGITVPD